MGDCHNYGPLIGSLKYNRDPKRDHDFDNPPYESRIGSSPGEATTICLHAGS